MKWTRRQRLVPGIPVIGDSSRQARLKNRERFRHSSKKILSDGYTQTNGGFFYVPSPPGEKLMIPVRYLEDLKTAPMDKVDFVGTLIEMFEGKYTTFGSRSSLHPRTLKADLNKNLLK